MVSDLLDLIRDMYDERVPTDDEKTMRELANSTKLSRITIPAERAVGSSGTVIGGDIISRSLDIAMSEADKQGSDIPILDHDVASFDGLTTHDVKEAIFDIITCRFTLLLVEIREP
ncbi:putative ubiE/COQ5 methyltransferase [Drepanopeziza brunnea f. sp. 'multigermtubi' MB_m1]|uniref:Putative ubiE/COQ5 methyltransferase n=1 Tax=Marssonina brunnea f. sp. multigermtubi (strain MB_m1) TaxID=1072389 RepID=K1WV97_MARBU|nr:putative ubiE/COQ5 methyltransferase [Drepanopeziza brunnea f. sp. 'multigermtubi' MB_m1]EKD21560.1 putative ubiE/COQ5 methyltransferase [Drepanopeziza brunnea f. sp. 'multigermtubi' MB_m1]